MYSLARHSSATGLLATQVYEWQAADKNLSTERKGILVDKSFEIMNQTQETMFFHISKHQVKNWKCNVKQSTFDQLFVVFGNVAKHCLECLI